MKQEKSIPRTDKEKNRQIRKEARLTLLLFLFGAIWSTVTAFGLSGCQVYILHLPLWWWLSVPGQFIICMAGLLLMLKFVFTDFDLGEEQEDEHE